jgi:branched-chain amino acid transport system permease protein
MIRAEAAVMNADFPVAKHSIGTARAALAIAIAAIALAGFFTPLLVTQTYQLNLLLRGVQLAVAAVGLGFLMHQSGLVMIGASAFIGMPMYLVAIGSNLLQLGTTGAVVFALVCTLLFAALSGALVIRTKPLPFAMISLALTQMLKTIVSLPSLRPVMGGDDGLRVTLTGNLLGMSPAAFYEPASFWPLTWGALCIVLLLAWTVGKSRLGIVLRAIKANEERMAFSGFNTYLPRLAGFVLACSFMAVAGILMVLNTAFASPEVLDFIGGNNALPAMLLGGTGNAFGPVLGALFFTWMEDSFGAAGHLDLLMGLAVVIVLALCPKGLIGLLVGACRWLQAQLQGKR